MTAMFFNLLVNSALVFIKEEKYGYDLKHFPCLSLKANHAYGLLALVAHNLMRRASIHDNPCRPRFAKGFRNKFIKHTGKNSIARKALGFESGCCVYQGGRKTETGIAVQAPICTGYDNWVVARRSLKIE
jgi:hypothetical protein